MATANDTMRRVQEPPTMASPETAGEAARAPGRPAASGDPPVDRGGPPPRIDPRIWSDFAQWCSTGLLVICTPGDTVTELRRAQVVAANRAAGNLLARATLRGASLADALDPILSADDWGELAAGVAGWGPQELSVESAPLALNIRVHRQPGHIALGIEDATYARQIERALMAQANVLAERDRELRVLLGGLRGQLDGLLRAQSRAALREQQALHGAARLGRFDPSTEGLESTRALAALVGDLAGRGDTTMGRVDLAAVVAAVIADRGTALQAADLQVLADRLPSIWGVRRDVSRVVQLLLSHLEACGTDRGRRLLRISAAATRDGWRMTVTEEGGRPAEQAPSELSTEARFWLAACGRLMRLGQGSMGRSVDGRGAVPLWVEWPGHGR